MNQNQMNQNQMQMQMNQNQMNQHQMAQNQNQKGMMNNNSYYKGGTDSNSVAEFLQKGFSMNKECIGGGRSKGYGENSATVNNYANK
jgi:hypothetical protein